MKLVSWNWFWYVLLGFIMGGGVVYLWVFIKEKSLKLAWYELVLAIISFLIFLLMGQTFIASFNEGEPRAAVLTLFFMGIPIIIFMVITVRSIRARLARN